MAHIRNISAISELLRYVSFIFVFLVGFVLSLTSSAQIRVELRQDVLTATDTVWVDVVLDVPEDPGSIKAISSYQFKVQTSNGLLFLASDESYSLTDKKGWTSGFSSLNGKVGAFSSSADAILEDGVLIRLQFVLSKTDTPGELELYDFRLNSGDPDHTPAVPSLRLDLTSHDE